MDVYWLFMVDISRKISDRNTTVEWSRVSMCNSLVRELNKAVYNGLWGLKPWSIFDKPHPSFTTSRWWSTIKYVFFFNMDVLHVRVSNGWWLWKSLSGFIILNADSSWRPLNNSPIQIHFNGLMLRIITLNLPTPLYQHIGIPLDLRYRGWDSAHKRLVWHTPLYVVSLTLDGLICIATLVFWPKPLSQCRFFLSCLLLLSYTCSFDGLFAFSCCEMPISNPLPGRKSRKLRLRKAKQVGRRRFVFRRRRTNLKKMILKYSEDFARFLLPVQDDPHVALPLLLLHFVKE